MEDGGLRVVLVDAAGPLGEALAQALLRLGSRLTCCGGAWPDLESPAVRRVPGDRHRPDGFAALGPGDFDAAVDFGARGLEGAPPLARALRDRVGLVVQLGSWRVYAGAAGPGDGEEGLPVPCPETAPKRDGVALDAEDGLWNVRAAGGYPATVLRLPPLYGPGVGLAREWYVLGRLRAGRRWIALPDGGGQLLHRLYVDNAVHAILRALDHPREADGHAFNVGDSRVPTLAEVCRLCAAEVQLPLLGVPLPGPLLPGDHPWVLPGPVVLDLHRLRARLGYVEPVTPEQGLTRTVRWLWGLAPDDVLPVLSPYWERFASGHDYAAEDAALARWQGLRGRR